MIAGLLVCLALGWGCGGDAPPDTSKALACTVARKDVMQKQARTKTYVKAWVLIKPVEALTHQALAQTAIAAALDLQISHDAHTALVFVTTDRALMRRGLWLARAEYTPSGRDLADTAQVARWNVRASNRPPSPLQARAVEMRASLRNQIGDYQAAVEKVAADLGLTPEQVQEASHPYSAYVAKYPVP